MEILLVLLGLFVVGGIVVMVFVAGAASSLVARDEKRSRAAEADSERLLAELFDGTEQVSYRLAGGMSEQTVLAGAARHGYTLVSTTSNQYGGTERLYFRKA